MTCKQCNTHNEDTDRYCRNCGADLRAPHREQAIHKSISPQKQSKKKMASMERILRWNPMWVTLVIIGGTLLVMSGLYWLNQSQLPQTFQATEVKNSDPAFEAKVMAVASKFVCSCGTCGEQPLDTCKCNTAIEERQFIRNYLQAGQTPGQIIAAVNNTFGFIKTEFAAQYASQDTNGSQSEKILVRDQQSLSTKVRPEAPSVTAKIASISDRIEIFSHFRCPCGKCGMDELKDCTCEHPHGAKEVKAFVDEKILHGKSTVKQLIDEVEKVYGSKKF